MVSRGMTNLWSTIHMENQYCIMQPQTLPIMFWQSSMWYRHASAKSARTYWGWDAHLDKRHFMLQHNINNQIFCNTCWRLPTARLTRLKFSWSRTVDIGQCFTTLLRVNRSTSKQSWKQQSFRIDRFYNCCWVMTGLGGLPCMLRRGWEKLTYVHSFLVR